MVDGPDTIYEEEFLSGRWLYLIYFHLHVLEDDARR